jgi:hypothetical protein
MPETNKLCVMLVYFNYHYYVMYMPIVVYLPVVVLLSHLDAWCVRSCDCNKLTDNTEAISYLLVNKLLALDCTYHIVYTQDAKHASEDNLYHI